jgi:hypothetical protein
LSYTGKYGGKQSVKCTGYEKPIFSKGEALLIGNPFRYVTSKHADTNAMKSLLVPNKSLIFTTALHY